MHSLQANFSVSLVANEGDWVDIIKNFDQPVHKTDLDNAKSRSNMVKGYNIVVGARSGDVTFYDASGEIATFDIKVFKSITGRK